MTDQVTRLKALQDKLQLLKQSKAALEAQVKLKTDEKTQLESTLLTDHGLAPAQLPGAITALEGDIETKLSLAETEISRLQV